VKMRRRFFLKALLAAVTVGVLGSQRAKVYDFVQEQRIDFNYDQLRKYAKGIYTYSPELKNSFDVLYNLSKKDKLTSEETALLANLREKILKGMESIYEKNKQRNEGKNYDANVAYYNT